MGCFFWYLYVLHKPYIYIYTCIVIYYIDIAYPTFMAGSVSAFQLSFKVGGLEGANKRVVSMTALMMVSCCWPL